MTDAAFTSFLVQRGLTSIGSAETLEDLRQRLGLRKSVDEGKDVVELPTVSLFRGQIDRFFIRWRERSCRNPPSGYECYLDPAGNAVQTHHRFVTWFTDQFGTPETGSFGKGLSAFWKFQRMSLTIFTDQIAKDAGATTCRVSIDRNWIPAMTPAEINLIRSLQPDQITPVHKFPALSGSSLWEAKPGAAMGHWLSVRDWERGLFRLMPEGIGIHAEGSPYLWKGDDVVGWSGGGCVLIFQRTGLRRLELNQIEGAKGPAGSTLELRLSNPFSLKHEDNYYRLFDGESTDSLNEVANAISARWEFPLTINRFPNI